MPFRRVQQAESPAEPQSSQSASSLRQSEERFHLMVSAVKDYAIFMLDPGGHIISWNEGAERIKGWTEEEILGKHFSTFYTQDALDQRWPQRELEIAIENGRLEDEGWRVRKDGTRFWANVVITALFDDDGTHVGFAKVTRDMTDRRRIESLELAERRMMEFLAMLSHELRNPLAPIRNAVSTMYLKEVADPDIRRARDVVDRQVKHLTQLVDDLLDVNRITSGTIRLKREPVLLARVIERAVEASNPIMEVRGHTVHVTLPDTPLSVNGDLTRLTQIVNNLLNNAAKYTPEGGHVWLSLEQEGQHAVIRAKDDGVGIPPEMRDSIFDLFKQGERTLDRSEGGLGLGLTLVRELVSRHLGSVEAYSEGTNRGSEFVVRLPLVEVRDAPEEQGRSRNGTRANGSRSVRVLVVDDNPDIAESMAMLLEMWGYSVRTAGDGPSALRLAREYHPEVVFLDIGLPQMDGYQVARELQAMDDLPAMTLIALTGYGQREDLQRSQEAGFEHHVVKPADPDELLALLEEVSSSLAK